MIELKKDRCEESHRLRRRMDQEVTHMITRTLCQSLRKVGNDKPCMGFEKNFFGRTKLSLTEHLTAAGIVMFRMTVSDEGLFVKRGYCARRGTAVAS